MPSPTPNPKPSSLIDLAQEYNSHEDCLRLLESLRWPDGPLCPKCESKTAYQIRNGRLYECADCGHQFSVTSGTVLHRSHVPLSKWIMATAIIANARGN